MPSSNWYSKNKEKALADHKRWREENRDYDLQRKRDWYYKEGRKRDLKKKYNLTVEEYEKLLKKQNNRCAICKEETKLNVDHNHETGEVRGLLCYDCNRNFIGSKTDSALFRKAADYLDGKREKVT